MFRHFAVAVHVHGHGGVAKLSQHFRPFLGVFVETPKLMYDKNTRSLGGSRVVPVKMALELHAFAASKVPTLSRVLKDQLERASLSVVLNLDRKSVV